MSTGTERIPALRLITFAIGGVPFAAAADQVSTVSDVLPPTGQVVCLRQFLGEGLWPGGAAGSSSALLVEGNIWVAVETILDIREIPVSKIRPLPFLVDMYMREKGFWGVIPSGGSVVILIDFSRILANPAFLAALLPQGDRSFFPAEREVQMQKGGHR